MARYDFWTHGADTIVEFPERAQLIQHAGFGTVITQAADTDNWFHVAIPTPTVIQGTFSPDTSVNLASIWLRARVNQNARIDLLHFLDDDRLIYAENVMLTDRTINQEFNNPNKEVDGGLLLAMHVQFLSGEPTGEIIIMGAGAHFET